MYLFNRSITVNVRSVDGKILSVDGFFLDSHHEFCLTLGVDLVSNTIVSAECESRRVPHSDCELSKNKIEKLIGVDLNQHVRRQIRAAIGSEQGCTHLTDLALECIKGVIQAKFRLRRMNMQAENDIMIQQYLAGTCQHYKRSYD
ncbi:MAG: DUF2889 domain-containing protein [Bacillota bacterium]|nr:DUF2889 domain-containing protein [Bacillota bacterium]MDP4159233.1 DUF2889 domain-containing protein [Bacillota bacterium]